MADRLVPDATGREVTIPQNPPGYSLQAWAPEVIITIDRDFAANAGRMPEWQGVPAMANGRVYLPPAVPFSFIDATPLVNRLAGLIWLSHRLYPDVATGDLRAKIADFYELFYGIRPDEPMLTGLPSD